MAYPPERFYRNEDLTNEQKATYLKGVRFRGDFIEGIIQIENVIELCISTFLGAKKNIKTERFLFYLMGDRSMSLSVKIQIIQQIAYLDISDADKFETHFNLLRKLNELRTYLAHFMIDLDITEGLGFFKRKTKYKVLDPKESSQKQWVGWHHSIILTDIAISQIFEQLHLVNDFIMLFEDGLDKDKVEGHVKYQPLKAYSADLLSPEKKQGAFSIVI